MIPIANRFLINEEISHWSKNSISNVLGQRQLNKTGRPDPTATEKVENVRAAQSNVPPPKPVNLGMKPFKR